MLSIRFYFEEYIKNHPDRLYLNGSEEGLPIKGMKNMPLKEIVEKYCTKEYDIKGILDKKFKEEFEAENVKAKEIKIRRILEDITKKALNKTKSYKENRLILDILSNIRGSHNDSGRKLTG